MIKNFIKWYEFKRGVTNLIKYFHIVWNNYNFDYGSIFKMQKFQLEELLKVIKNGNEVDEDRLPKIKDIERCIELFHNIIEDDYLERSGYDHNRVKLNFVSIEENGETFYEMVDEHPNKYSKKEHSKIFNDSEKLRKKEWDELWDTIKKGKESPIGINGWWD